MLTLFYSQKITKYVHLILIIECQLSPWRNTALYVN